jgi:hypothetical protein
MRSSQPTLLIYSQVLAEAACPVAYTNYCSTLPDLGLVNSLYRRLQYPVSLFVYAKNCTAAFSPLILYTLIHVNSEAKETV